MQQCKYPKRISLAAARLRPVYTATALFERLRVLLQILDLTASVGVSELIEY